MNIWDILTAGMPQRYVAPDDCDFWFDGNEILCRTEIQATALFVMLDRLLPQTIWIVSQHLPDDEDIECAGWYYVSAPGGVKE